MFHRPAGQLVLVPAVFIHQPDLITAAAIGNEGYGTAIGTETTGMVVAQSGQLLAVIKVFQRWFHWFGVIIDETVADGAAGIVGGWNDWPSGQSQSVRKDHPRSLNYRLIPA